MFLHVAIINICKMRTCMRVQIHMDMLCVQVCVHSRVCVDTYVHVISARVYTCTCVCQVCRVYMHVYVDTYVHVMCARVYIEYVHVMGACVCVHTLLCRYICACYVCKCVDMQVCAQICVCYVRTCVHTYICYVCTWVCYIHMINFDQITCKKCICLIRMLQLGVNI